MKYVPASPNFVFEPITTPNKNIQSYFMKSDQSYYTDESLKYPKYGSSGEHIQILIDNGTVQICGKRYDVDFFDDYRLNLGKYKIASRCLDEVYSLLFNDIKRRKAAPPLREDSPLCDRPVTKKEQVSLIIGDFFGRSEILSFIDIVINQLGFKVVIVLPISLCMSFDLNQNYCSFVYKSGFSFIDDFALVDTFVCSPGSQGLRNSVKADDEDFAEEFSRLSVIDPRLKYSCDECGQKEECLEKVQAHIAKEHGEGTYYFYEGLLGEDIHKSMSECFHSRIRYLFNKEKCEKIAKKTFCVGVDFEGAERVPLEKVSGDGSAHNADHYEVALRGAQTFVTLEVAKDLWMTDHEWRNARLRALKEKLLFYI